MSDVVGLSLDFDHRIKSHALSARATYGWYLEKSVGAEHNLKIQREIIKGKKSYQTLRADLARGCLLPTIVIAVHSDKFPDDFSNRAIPDETRSSPAFVDRVADIVAAATPDQIQIIDGLQRTNALREAARSLADTPDLETFLARPLRLEIWPNIPFFSLAYRMLLLNAGQRPMSMKHQIEILADNLSLAVDDIPDLEVKKTIDRGRRVRPGQFQLVRITEMFQAWLQGQPHIDLRNVIAEQILSDDAVDALGAGLGSTETGAGQADFRSFLAWLVQADLALGASNLSFFQNETVLQGISAAVGEAQRNPDVKDRLTTALQKLLEDLRSRPEEDAFGVEIFDTVRVGIDPKRQNVGEATRNIAFKAFKDFVYYSGETPMRRCWTVAASST